MAGGTAGTLSPMPEETRLFYVLVPTYRVIRGVPVVHLYGVSDRGESVLCVDDRARPYLFVPLADLDAAGAAAGAREARPEPELRDLEGRPVGRLSFGQPREVPPARERLDAAGIVYFEADVRFAYRYMIDEGIRGTVEVRGPAEPGRWTDLVFRRPYYRPARFTPELSVLSLDIETDRRAASLFCVALSGAGLDEVIIRSPRPVEGAEAVPDERALLRRMVERIEAADPDVITGWNVVDFDLKVLDRRARELGVPLPLGRGDGAIMFQDDPGFTRSGRASVPGRQVLDGLPLVRDVGLDVEDHRLNTVAEHVLGRGKLASGPGRVEEIERAFREDPAWLARYNLEDARLVPQVLEKTRALKLALERSLLTGMPLDRVGASVATFDFLYLGELRRDALVAPTVSGEPRAGYVVGGTVLDSRPGIFSWVAVLDFKSLYPSVIRTFGIDPVAFAGAGDLEEGMLRSPNGALFRRGDAILPRLVSELHERRNRAKAEGDRATSTAVKLLMNSFYGVLGTASCRFANSPVANAITSFGGEILRRTKAVVEAMGLTVLYGDTDSVFVLTGAAGAERAREVGERIRAEVDSSLAAWARETHGVESKLELELEKIYRRFFLPHVRGGAEGSKKRYAGLIADGGEGELQIVGLEAVRRDWPRVGRDFQTELLRRVFSGGDVEAYVVATVRALRAGEYDADCVYRKVLRKDPDEYVRSEPPHVRAARAAGKRKGSVIHYVITRRGPAPVGRDDPPPEGIDHDHYVSRVLEPIADAILPFLGYRFEELSGADPQLKLF